MPQCCYKVTFSHKHSRRLSLSDLQQITMAATSEDIQTLILTTLDSQGAIENTNTLKNPDGTPIPYLAVVGVLNSLASKEVCTLFVFAIISAQRCFNRERYVRRNFVRLYSRTETDASFCLTACSLSNHTLRWSRTLRLSLITST